MPSLHLNMYCMGKKIVHVSGARRKEPIILHKEHIKDVIFWIFLIASVMVLHASSNTVWASHLFATDRTRSHFLDSFFKSGTKSVTTHFDSLCNMP